MSLDRLTHKRLINAVECYLSTLRTDKRHSCVAWATKSTVHVACDWPNWRNGFRGLTGCTSCDRDSPVNSVVSRLAEDFEDSCNDSNDSSDPQPEVF